MLSICLSIQPQMHQCLIPSSNILCWIQSKDMNCWVLILAADLPDSFGKNSKCSGADQPSSFYLELVPARSFTAAITGGNEKFSSVRVHTRTVWSCEEFGVMQAARPCCWLYTSIKVVLHELEMKKCYVLFYSFIQCLFMTDDGYYI